MALVRAEDAKRFVRHAGRNVIARAAAARNISCLVRRRVTKRNSLELGVTIPDLGFPDPNS